MGSAIHATVRVDLMYSDLQFLGVGTEVGRLESMGVIYWVSGSQSSIEGTGALNWMVWDLEVGYYDIPTRSLALELKPSATPRKKLLIKKKAA